MNTNPFHSAAMDAASPCSLTRAARWAKAPAEAWDAPRVALQAPAEHRPGILGDSALDIEGPRARARREGWV